MERRTKQPHRYRIQTKLYHVEDVLVSFGPIRLTLRQCCVLMGGGSGTLNLWRVLDVLGDAGMPGMIIRIVLASLPMLVALLVAVVKIADRYTEAWAIVLFEYLMGERVYLSHPGLCSSSRQSRKGQRQAFQETRESREKEHQEDEYDA